MSLTQKVRHQLRRTVEGDKQYLSTVKRYNAEVTGEQNKFQPEHAAVAAKVIHGQGLVGTHFLTDSLTLVGSAETELLRLLAHVDEHHARSQKYLKDLKEVSFDPTRTADILEPLRSEADSFRADETHFVSLKSHLASLHPDNKEPVFEELSTIKAIDASLSNLLEAVIAIIKECLDTARPLARVVIDRISVEGVEKRLCDWIATLGKAQKQLPKLSEDLSRLCKPYIAWRHGRRYGRERDILEKYGTKEHQKVAKEFTTNFMATVKGLPGMGHVKDLHQHHKACWEKLGSEGIIEYPHAQTQVQSAQRHVESLPQRPDRAHVAGSSSQAGSSRHREQ